MRFYTIEKDGVCLPAVSIDGGMTAYPLKELGKDIASLVRDETGRNLEKIQKAAEAADPSSAVVLKEVKICAPIMHPDQDVVCLGINYTEHAEEAGRFSHEAFGGERPYTIYFSKRCSRATATGETIPSYEGLVDSLDYEAELGVVLGRDAKNVKAADADRYIFGYTIINDMSARNLQTRHKQWYVGKSLDGFTPMGPCIVTPDELGDAGDLDISSHVNGELRQNSNTSLMIQTVGGAIQDLTAGMTLKAGTIIAMGTPSGVGMGFTPPRFLKHGDEIICSIEGIGDLVNTID